MSEDFDAYVTAALFDRDGRAAFALGDGTVRFEGGASVQAHEAAILCAAAHPSGEGVISGGDDGRLVWTKADGARELARLAGKWIEVLAASPESGLIAFASGRELHVRDAADPGFTRVFQHEKSVADLAFDPKGRRIAAATYGGAALWYARIEGQKPQVMKWAGSHTAVAWSPDGKFLMTSMQDNQLHGWRLSDSKDLRMGGYPAKVKSLVFVAKGLMMATSGSSGVVIWPFAGANGPMGKEAAEIGFEQNAMVVRVAGTPGRDVVAAAIDDGRVWVADLGTGRREQLRADQGPRFGTLALTDDGKRLAWGDEEGAAGVVETGL
jgi:WD40 repeat protein